MPTECITNPLQRELADAIIRMVPLDEIRILLACGAKVNEPVTQGLMPLHYAVWQRYYEAAQLLLVRGGDVNAVDECGYSALHLAAEHGYAELVRLLLASGAKVDHRPDSDEPYPRTTLCDEPLRLAIRNKRMEIAKLLLEHGADPNKRYFFGSEINLVSDLDYLELLLTFGANPDSRDRAGLTPLMKAARHARGMDAVLLLISHGADVNASTDERHDYRTVLHYAVLSGDASIVNLLLKQGARINYAAGSAGQGRPTALDLAILKGDVTVVRLLLDAGAAVDRGSPVIGAPLQVACADSVPNRFDIVTELVARGADPNLRVYSEGGTEQLRPALAEYLASNEEPDLPLVRLLLRHGARVVMKTQFRDPDGLLNALHHVAAGSQLFHLLLDAAECFDPCMIRRSGALHADQRALLLQASAEPLTLRRTARVVLRRLLDTRLPGTLPQLQLPNVLVHYLLYNSGESSVPTGNQSLYEYPCPPSQWSQVPPQYMPWGHTPTSPAAPLVTFTAQAAAAVPQAPTQSDLIFSSGLNLTQPSTSGFGQRLPLHFKRKAELDVTVRPTKQHITEEKMAAHMSRLHISSETAPEDLSPPEMEDSSYREKRLYVCEEMRRLQTESILPSSLLGRLERPCMAVMLWQPPAKVASPLSGSTSQSVAQALAQVPRRTDDENDNDETATDFNRMDLES